MCHLNGKGNERGVNGNYVWFHGGKRPLIIIQGGNLPIGQNIWGKMILSLLNIVTFFLVVEFVNGMFYIKNRLVDR